MIKIGNQFEVLFITILYPRLPTNIYDQCSILVIISIHDHLTVNKQFYYQNRTELTRQRPEDRNGVLIILSSANSWLRKLTDSLDVWQNRRQLSSLLVNNFNENRNLIYKTEGAFDLKLSQSNMKHVENCGKPGTSIQSLQIEQLQLV